MLVRLLKNTDTTAGPKKAGDEIEHPDSHYLCQLGIAEPVDDAAKQKHAVFMEMKERRAAAMRKHRDEIYQAKLAERAERKVNRQKKFAKKIAI